MIGISVNATVKSGRYKIILEKYEKHTAIIVEDSHKYSVRYANNNSTCIDWEKLSELNLDTGTYRWVPDDVCHFCDKMWKNRIFL